MTAVEPIAGEHLRFRVRSRTKSAMSYLVDLQALDFNGQCGCDDFQYRRRPLLRKLPGARDTTRCVHIRMAREWLLDRLLRYMATVCRQPMMRDEVGP